MKELLKDILEIKGVNGIIVLTDEGQTIFKEVMQKTATNPDNVDWNPFITAVQGCREMELVYEKGMIYVRKIEFGFMLVLVELNVQVAIIRLNCDIVLPSLQNLKSNKKFKHLFKK